MAKRVYEAAREAGISPKEALARLDEAGVRVMSHLAVVEDPVYERIFRNGTGGENSLDATPYRRPGAWDADAAPRGLRRPRWRARTLRALAYVLVGVLAFVLAMGVGALAAMVL
jgi:hypothetical protein